MVFSSDRVLSSKLAMRVPFSHYVHYALLYHEQEHVHGLQLRSHTCKQACSMFTTLYYITGGYKN